MDMSGFERDPKKRRVKPGPAQQSLLDFDDLGESSDDSDFRIEDHKEESDDDSIDSDDAGKDGADDDSEEDDDDSDDDEGGLSMLPSSGGGQQDNKKSSLSMVERLQQHLTKTSFDPKESLKVFICCSCLGDRSDDINEIVECDGCGATVHEGCYGVSDSTSISSTVSSCSTAPWFCEACRAGVMNPTCELCPNTGGIFKETDVGKWVHLVCALYVPGVAFGEVDKLSSVTLFEMPYNKWGAKTCSLCTDQRFSRTGVCIECDAGMCRTFFHVTCAQRDGLLSETHSEEVDQADPFYAHCKMHTDKSLIRKRRRNWMSLQLRTHQRQLEYEQVGNNLTPEQLRIKRKLAKYRQKYLALKSTRTPPWVPTQKIPRLLTTSASAVRKLNRKTELMGIDTQALQLEEAQVASLVDIRKKWHIAPAFSVEYIGYYLDRNQRMVLMKEKGEKFMKTNGQLQEEQQLVRVKYDNILAVNTRESKLTSEIKPIVLKYHSIVSEIIPHKELPAIDHLCKPTVQHHVLNSTQKINFEVKGTKSSQMSLNECGVCRQTNDQHLLAKCDACHLFYHLGCLNPPLTRMPKKTKLMGWQCSECDKESSGSEVECLDFEAPRKLRHKENEKYDEIIPKLTFKPLSPPYNNGEEAMEADNVVRSLSYPDTSSQGIVHSMKLGKKRRREKHRRYSPGPIKEHKRKRKRKSNHMDRMPEEKDHPRIKIKIKPIPRPEGDCSPYGPQMFVATSTTETSPLPTSSRPNRNSGSGSATRPVVDVMTRCDVCESEGTNQDLVRCDECKRCFHFTCLDPPVKKSPKRRGYSWHCADCDPTESESDVK